MSRQVRVADLIPDMIVRWGGSPYRVVKTKKAPRHVHMVTLRPVVPQDTTVWWGSKDTVEVITGL